MKLDMKVSWMVGLILLVGIAPACAAEPATDGIGFVPALQLAQAAIDDCQARGYPASASVVDAKGVVRVTLRGDGAIKPPVAAPIKAFTAFTFNQAGSDMQAREQSDAAFKAQIEAHSDLYNDHAGSLPLHHDSVLIGGLAVADVPHEIADACARAALAKYPQ